MMINKEKPRLQKTVYIEKETFKQLKIYAALKEQNLSETLNLVLKEFFETKNLKI